MDRFLEKYQNHTMEIENYNRSKSSKKLIHITNHSIVNTSSSGSFTASEILIRTPTLYSYLGGKFF